jgi:hypothetical protein
MDGPRKSVRITERSESGNSSATDGRTQPDTPALAVATVEGLLAGCHSLAALEAVHQSVLAEVAASFGAPVAVQAST